MSNQKQKLLVTFSGGRSSGRMAHLMKKNYSDKFDLLFVFANTGQENDETLDFVNECDKAFDLGVVWVEAVVHEGRVASTHKVVTYETATRRKEFDDSPYTEVVKKYGIPNKAYMHCTRELKENPIHHYVQNVKGWKKREYMTAIGIRGDEPRRLKRNDNWQNKCYPLADIINVSQQDIWDFWKGQDFDLGIEDYQGNCAWCFKKCEKKLKRILADDPEIFDYPDYIEREFGSVGKNKIKGVHVAEPRTLYRNYKTASILIAEVKEAA